jgi:outer membrane protein assembly factor BamA
VEDIGDEIVFNQYYTLTKGMAAGFNAALVGDNSYFGLTGPLYGYRFRISAEQSYGYNEYFGILADFRKYIWKKPVSFAFRALAYSRWNKDVNSIYPLYIGQMGFVRGYDFLFSNNPDNVVGDIAFDQLLGSKAGLASFEIRAPFTGPKQLALIGSNVLFTDLSLFFDVGLAFDEFSEISDRDLTAIAMSAGVSVRINLFGAMILEPYWAYPLPNGKVPENNRIVFGLNFIPGW